MNDVFADRRVTAEDLRAMAALDASKLPYGMQERFYQVRVRDGSVRAILSAN